MFARPVVEEKTPAMNDRAVEQSAASAATTTLPPLRPQSGPVATDLEDDAIIKRFELLLMHCPRNTKVLEMLAEAHARKGMFDQSLSFYRRALAIAGGKNAAIEEAIEATTLKRFDLELNQLDPKAPDQAVQREQIQNRRSDYQWHELEESSRRDDHQAADAGIASGGVKTS
jgi:cytochrome c-type biogenesis protein CcmH/NrfG